MAGSGHASTVTVEFRAEGERTTVVLEHTGLPYAESRDRHAPRLEGLHGHLRRRAFARAA